VIKVVVIDPKNQVDGIFDVAMSGGKLRGLPITLVPPMPQKLLMPSVCTWCLAW
jgi:hypothetical protein